MEDVNIVRCMIRTMAAKGVIPKWKDVSIVEYARVVMVTWD